MPNPKKGEKKEKFISRCAGSKKMNKEFEDDKQKLAVCYSKWDRKDESNEQPLTFMQFLINEEATYSVGDYVEYQPMHGRQPRGRSKNVRITKVLPNGQYETNIGKVIKAREILGKNLS